MKQRLASLFILISTQLYAIETGAIERGITLKTTTGELYGSVMLPAACTQCPVALIIAGSGATDRDGNITSLPGKNDSLKKLASALAMAGIASVRYDKRGVGASRRAAKDEGDLRFEHYVEDATLWLKTLQKDTRFSGTAVIGHSEGALIGILAAQRTPVEALVSLAGPAMRASDVLRIQLATKLPAALLTENDAILASLEKGQEVTHVPSKLGGLYRASVQPYLISWFKYVPETEFKQLKMPALIVQGDTDIQVQVRDAETLKLAKPDAELQIIQGMNHVLKSVPSDQAKQIASYSDPSLPLTDKLPEVMTQFLLQVMQGKDTKPTPLTTPPLLPK